MKNLKKIQKRALVIVAVLFVSIAGCDITGLQDSIDDFALVIGLEPINTGSSVLLTDAETGELIEATVSVTFVGQNGPDVIDMFSDPINRMDVEEGIFSFGVNNSVVPTPESPTKVKLRLEAEGYIPAIKTVEITETGISDFAFTMVSESNKPVGIKDISASVATNNDGTLASDLEVISGDTTTSVFSSSINIPEGTAFEDENGNTLTGNITAQMTYYNPSESSALENFPFDTDLFSNDENSVTMILGVSSVVITDQQGKLASKMFTYGKNKEKLVAPALTFVNTVITDIDLSDAVISVPGEDGFTTINSSTTCSSGRCTTVSSDIPLAKKYKKSQLMKALDMQELVVISVDLPAIPPTFKTYNQLIINHSGWSGIFRYDLFAGAQSGVKKFKTELTQGSEQTILSNNLRLLDDTGKKNLFRVYLPVSFDYEYSSPLPSGNALTITLPQKPVNTNFINVDVEVELKCTNPEEKLSLTDIPLAAAYIRQVGTNSWRKAIGPTWNYDKEEQVLKGGSVVANGMLEGEDYQFWVIYDGKSEKEIISITDEQIKITISESIDSYCN